MSSGDNQFTLAKYQGHTAPVLSLAVSEDCLLSGSEDHTARLWDLRENSRRRASLCIQAGGEVLSATFTPKQNHEISSNGGGPPEEEEEELASPFAKNHSMYAFSIFGTMSTPSFSFFFSLSFFFCVSTAAI